MLTLSHDDFQVTNEWVNIIETRAPLASLALTLQCVTGDRVQVVLGGATEPTQASGVVLKEDDSVNVQAAQIWVKCLDGNGATLSITEGS